MSARAGPSRLRHSSALPQAPDGRPQLSNEESDLVDLIARFSIQDVEQLENLQKGKRREGAPLTDAELALSIFAEEAQALLQFNSDRVLAEALNEMEESTLLTPLDDPTGRSHRGNVRMQPQPGLPRRNRSPAAIINPQNEESWGSMFISALDWLFGSTATSTSHSTKPVTNTPVRRSGLTGKNCVICQDPIRGAQIRAPCGHYYDTSCITDLFQAATRDESLFPPRCCRQLVSLTTVRQHLTPALITLFTEKEKEFTTLKKVYCANPTCSRFLGPQSRSMVYRNIITCPVSACKTRTCGSCRARVEEGERHTCKAESTDQEVLALGKSAGWARCPGCDQMIELQMGCYHMTCLCKTEFCYLCTARWKTCQCTQWDERRLVTAAEARVDLQYGRAGGIRQADVRPARAAQVRTPPAQRRTADPFQDVPVNVAVRSLLRSLPQTAPVPNVRDLARNPPSESRMPPIWREVAHSQDATFTWDATATVPPHDRHAPRASLTSTARAFNMADRLWLVQEAVEDLRVNHQCLHSTWKFRSGGGQCQTCHRLPIYLFRCSGCQALACSRCRRNRL